MNSTHLVDFTWESVFQILFPWKGIGKEFPILVFEFYLVILEGTFSDDMITTGIFLKDEDSCKISKKKKKSSQISHFRLFAWNPLYL